MKYKAPDNSLHALDDACYEYLLPSGSIQITEEESEVIRAKQKQDRDAATAVITVLTLEEVARAIIDPTSEAALTVKLAAIDAEKAKASK